MSVRGILENIKSKYQLNGGTLSFKQKLLIALPGPASVLGSIIIHNTLMKYYTDIIGISPVYIGWIYFIYNIWNAINDPLFGVFIDHMPYRPKRGKYVYLMRVTAPIMILSIVGMLLSSPGWNEWLIFAALLAELFLFDTAYTVYSIAYQSYFLIIAPTLEERVDIEVIRSYVGNAIGFLATLIPTLLLVGNGNRMIIIPVFMGVILINTLILFLALRGIKDTPDIYKRIEQEPKSQNFKEVWSEALLIIKSKPFLTYMLFFITMRGAIGYYFTPFLYYMDDVMESSGIIATLADVIPGILMLAVLPVVGSYIKKLGSKNVLLLSYIPALLGFGGLLFIKKPVYAVICYCLIVLALNMCQTAGVSINGELIDENEQRTGVRKTGLFNGIFALFTTMLTSIQAVIFSYVISAFGYQEKAITQSAHAVLGIRIGTALVPILFSLIGLIPLLLFPINHKREMELSEFSAGQKNDSNCSSLND